MRKWLSMGLAALLVIAMLAGCSKGSNAPAGDSSSSSSGSSDGSSGTSGNAAAKEEGKVLIGYGAPELVGGQLAIQNSLVDWAQKSGFAVMTTNAGGDPAKQADQVDYFINLGVQAIVVVPVDSAAICASVKKARAAGVPFYTIDRAPVGCEADMVVLSDNKLAGKQAAEVMVEELTKKYGEPKGTVVELQGDLGTDVAVARGEGFNEHMKGYPNIKIIQKPMDWQADECANIVRDIVSTQDIDGLYFHSDAVCVPSVLPTLEQLGKLEKRGEPGHIFITGVDGAPVAVQAMKDGYVDGAGAQPIPDFGLVVEFIQMRIDGKEVQPGPFARDGALWSPAEIKKAGEGYLLYLSTTKVTAENMDHPGLWANQ